MEEVLMQAEHLDHCNMMHIKRIRMQLLHLPVRWRRQAGVHETHHMQAHVTGILAPPAILKQGPETLLSSI